LEEINAALKEEYRGRQEVLLKRLDVTLQTFLWSEKANVSSSSSPSFFFLGISSCLKIYDILNQSDWSGKQRGNEKNC
jgi:hypothetical protein